MAGYFIGYLEQLVEEDVSQQTIQLDFVGFSHGAATARVFANIIESFIDGQYDALEHLDRINYFGDHIDREELGYQERLQSAFGILDSCKNVQFNLGFMGLFDTVPHYALGEQDDDIEQLPLGVSDKFDRVTHAVAANENRADFAGVSIHNDPNVNNNGDRIELGFVGAHADIGGGYKEGDLSDVALNWMAQQAGLAGVKIELKDPQKIVQEPVVHDSLDVLPFVNADRDFKYMDNITITDQAGNTAPDDSNADIKTPQTRWNESGIYGLDAENIMAAGFFGDSYMENDVKKLDGEDNRTMVGLIRTKVTNGQTYQEWLKKNYGVDIEINYKYVEK